MLKIRPVLILSSLVFCLLLVLGLPAKSAAEGTDPDHLFSPSVGQKFHEIACELADSQDVNDTQTQQAIIFLAATMSLDSSANYVLSDMIKFACRHSVQDRSELVRNLLAKYVDKSSDLQTVRIAVQYLFEQLNSREQREKLLDEMLKTLGGKNNILDSELATLLGLLMAEKADLQTAQFYLMRAYNDNKYNNLAFTKLAELAPDQIGPTMYLEHLRLVLGENPLNIDSALAFAQYAQQLQLYETAADAYGYCADLFAYLYPSQPLPASIYLPWAISNYNTSRSQHRVLQIADRLRQSGCFDLLLEAVAGKAAVKVGNAEQAKKIFQTAESKAEQLFNQAAGSSTKLELAKQLAWFYSFALPDTQKALDWANKAYSIEPKSALAAAMLAYSLVANGQTDWAKTLIDNYDRSPIADLAMAQIQLAQQQQSPAIQTLKSLIASDPGSLVAERAKQILAQQGAEYISPIDSDTTLAVLRNTFGPTLVPIFIRPEKAISVQINVRGDKFSYDSEFGGSVAIINNSTEPLVLSDDGLFKGYIRVDANISGDLNKKIPNLVSLRVQSVSPVGPGGSIIAPLQLLTGQLRRTLLDYPQASLNIEFTVFVDPVVTDQNTTSRLPDIKPVTLVVKRPGIELSSKYLQNRINSLSKGQQGQKIKTAQLFASLLMEEHVMAHREPLYKFMYADWMPAMLKSALLHNLADQDWVVKTNTMAAMSSLPLDYELIDAVAKNLNDTHWPVRMMTIYLLAKAQGSNFGKVLNWTAQYDSNGLVRNMAITLGATPPKPAKPQEPNQPEQKSPQQPAEPNK